MPNSRRNLDIAIERLFPDRNTAIQARRTIANVIVGQMMPEGVVKGGSAMKVRFGFDKTRGSRDLDTARTKDVESFIKALSEELERGWNGFTGRIVPLTSASPEGVPPQYVMQPFEVKLNYNAKPWLTVPLEVGHDEIGDADEPEYYIAPDIIKMFRSLGFPDPAPLPLMPLHHQIAQKLHGASEPGSTRFHDLADLQIIVTREEIDWKKTKETCMKLFKYRMQQQWPPTVVENEGWADGYAVLVEDEKIEVLQSIEQAIEWTNELIRRIETVE
ncbi:MAG: nucleotidyl transferase AbiEii/AbiGii toxin family protein [Eggerthellaceae bacterium]|nr:nucleotidyl transferase AbiEii/AbiGii toxin family protein [Eggerthellaceae bacterium]MBQ9022008.1 nucleotidyl transferase AbiEii/AbiGii toxin family protein [Eggerthellaceae bacterium]